MVGDGPDLPELKALSEGKVKFVGRVGDVELRELYAKCRAVIFPSHEDYGIVPIEAQASGKGVIAYGRGGALETVVENQTGVFFGEQTVESVVDAIVAFEKMQLDPQEIRRAVIRFDVPHFIHELREFALNL